MNIYDQMLDATRSAYSPPSGVESPAISPDTATRKPSAAPGVVAGSQKADMKTATHTPTKSSVKKFTSEQIADLKQLKRGLKDSQGDVAALIKSASVKTAEAMAEIILHGQRLQNIRQIIGHSAFIGWLATELHWTAPDIRTGQNWMKQAKNKSVSFLPTTDIQEIVKSQDKALDRVTQANELQDASTS